MVEQTYAPISRVDIDRLYVDGLPESWKVLEERTVQLLEKQEISTRQSQVMSALLRALESKGTPLPDDADELYMLMRPLLEAVPGGYA